MELVIYPPIFAIWKWNFEVKPKLKKSKPTQFTPEPQQDMVNV
jgi:hypothetical protein